MSKPRYEQPPGRPVDPRLLGIDEHYLRARRFVGLAKRSKQKATRFRNLMAAIYPARAVVELMLTAAELQFLPSFLDRDIRKSRAMFEKEIRPRLPYYQLVEIIRIHDFHRFGCLLPDETYHNVSMQGPIKLTASRGSAALLLSPSGPVSVTTGESRIVPQRPLIVADGKFFDEESSLYLDLAEILDCYLQAVPSVITYFESLLS